MIILGLTGSIGMGKTTVACQFAALGAHVSNADDIVHRFLAPKGRGVEPVARLFPEVARDSGAGRYIDRGALGAIVFKDKGQLHRLERVLHPLVVAQEERFVHAQAAMGAKLVVLDIPLLYETGAQKRCHAVVVATAPFHLQKQRVMQRPHMTEAKFASIIASQMPDREKRRRADLVVNTGLGRGCSFRIIKTWLAQMGVGDEA